MDTKEQTSAFSLIYPLMRRYLRPQWTLVSAGVAAGVVAAAASGFGLPVMLQYVFPVVFGTMPAPAWLQDMLYRYVSPQHIGIALLAGSALLIPAIMMLRGIATFLNTYLLAKAGVRIVTDLRTDMFARLQWLSFSFHDRHQRGELMTMVIQFTQGIQQQMLQIMNDLVVQPLTLVAAVSYLVYAAVTNHESAVLLGNLLISALSIPLVRMVGKAMVRKMRTILRMVTTITSCVEESLAAQREVRAFNLQSLREDALRQVIRRMNRATIKMVGWSAALTPAIEIVSALALAYSLYRGCGDGLTLEQFTAIATACYFCYDPLKKLGALTNACQTMGVMIEKVNTVLWAKDETPEPAVPRHLPVPPAGVVDFEHVDFSYDGEKPVLRDITVHVEAGDTVALVGPSGSGKTTFINLICRFYDPLKGRVCLDGVDVRDLSREERTQAIALVSQFSALFRGSISENIRVGRPGASDAAVEEAGGKACVTEFANERPEGYGRVLDEGGTGLSGGQRQRVSIARAFLKNAPILILDEATSALDTKSEALVQEALERLAQGHTTFIIAHRFSAIRMARRILVFEEGRIIADGSHAQLYENCMLYRTLYDEQVRTEQERKEKAPC